VTGAHAAGAGAVRPFWKTTVWDAPGIFCVSTHHASREEAFAEAERAERERTRDGRPLRPGDTVTAELWDPEGGRVVEAHLFKDDGGGNIAVTLVAPENAAARGRRKARTRRPPTKRRRAR
jgi:hypothetical protein